MIEDDKYLLFIHLIWCYPQQSFASHWYNDGSTVADDFTIFIAGIYFNTGAVSYHIPVQYAGLIPNTVWLPVAPACTASGDLLSAIYELKTLCQK